MMYTKLISPDLDLADGFPGGEGFLNMAANYHGNGGATRLEELLCEAMKAPSEKGIYLFGLPLLCEQVAKKIAALYGYNYDPGREISITSGSNQSMYAAIAAFVSDGDEVILFEPANEAYLPAILLNGGKPVFIPLKEPDFHIDWEEVMRMITSKTRMIVINTPHNPTGMLLNELDMLRLQKIINGTRIVVVSDESFEHIIFDGQSHQSVALYPKLAEKSILVNSFSHTCQVSGWHVGYCAAPAPLMAEIRSVLKTMGSGVFAPFQVALAEFITLREEYLGIGKIYQAKRDLFAARMESQTRLEPLPAVGTFYQLYSYKNISTSRDYELVQQLIRDFGVGVAPYSQFFHEKSKRSLLRFNFAQPDEILLQVADRLQKLL